MKNSKTFDRWVNFLPITAFMPILFIAFSNNFYFKLPEWLLGISFPLFIMLIIIEIREFFKSFGEDPPMISYGHKKYPRAARNWQINIVVIVFTLIISFPLCFVGSKKKDTRMKIKEKCLSYKKNSFYKYKKDIDYFNYKNVIAALNKSKIKNEDFLNGKKFLKKTMDTGAILPYCTSSELEELLISDFIKLSLKHDLKAKERIDEIKKWLLETKRQKVCDDLIKAKIIEKDSYEKTYIDLYYSLKNKEYESFISMYCLYKEKFNLSNVFSEKVFKLLDNDQKILLIQMFKNDDQNDLCKKLLKNIILKNDFEEKVIFNHCAMMVKKEVFDSLTAKISASELLLKEDSIFLNVLSLLNTKNKKNVSKNMLKIIINENKYEREAVFDECVKFIGKTNFNLLNETLYPENLLEKEDKIVLKILNLLNPQNRKVICEEIVGLCIIDDNFYNKNNVFNYCLKFVDPNKFFAKDTYLYWATIKGDAYKVEKLLQKGANQKLVGFYKTTPLKFIEDSKKRSETNKSGKDISKTTINIVRETANKKRGLGIITGLFGFGIGGIKSSSNGIETETGGHTSTTTYNSKIVVQNGVYYPVIEKYLKKYL